MGLLAELSKHNKIKKRRWTVSLNSWYHNKTLTKRIFKRHRFNKNETAKYAMDVMQHIIHWSLQHNECMNVKKIWGSQKRRKYGKRASVIVASDILLQNNFNIQISTSDQLN